MKTQNLTDFSKSEERGPENCKTSTEPWKKPESGTEKIPGFPAGRRSGEERLPGRKEEPLDGGFFV